MKVIKVPDTLALIPFEKAIFLAGSIEMGKAENWRQRVERELSKVDGVIFNPRRDDWDSSWVQSIDNPQFREQVEWELTALENADIIAMYFDPTTKSPISLLEFGLFAKTSKLIVCCPEGFWRKGNVDIVCKKYIVEQVDSLQELINSLCMRFSIKSGK